MARILAISSFVAYGHVGLGAVVPALQALGHQVIALPTVVLSNHYGYKNVGASDVPLESFRAITEGLNANGWLKEVDGVITGYLPNANFVEAVRDIVGRIRRNNKKLVYLCDPVIGDDPKGLYVAKELAAAIRAQLLDTADVVTPNRFELSWLTGNEIGGPTQALTACQGLNNALAVATSVPAGAGELANVICDRKATRAVTRRYDAVPHGTGDLFAALLIGHIVLGRNITEAMARATAGVQVVIEASLGTEELRLIDTIQRAIAAEPAAVVHA